MTHKKEFTKGKAVFCKSDNKSFVSCVEAGVFYKIHPSYIGQACNGYVKEIRGKYFCWLEDKNTFVPKAKEISKGKCGPKPKAVLCITDGKEFTSVKEAAQFYGIPKSCVSDCCNGKLKKTHKMRFCFVADKSKYAEEIAVLKASKCTKFKVKPRFIKHKRKEV